MLCEEDHRYIGCKKQIHFCANALEYKPSLDTPHVSIALQTRLAKPMPVVTHYKQTNAFERLKQRVANHKFIIHEASKVYGLPVHQFENMKCFCHFLKKNGKPNETRTRIWVSGNLMNDLICDKLKKYKFVVGSCLLVRLVTV